MTIGIIVHGTKLGRQVFFSLNIEGAEDELLSTTSISVDWRSVVFNFIDPAVYVYSLEFTNKYKVFTIARSLYDSTNSPGYLAISLCLSKETELPADMSITSLLYDLMEMYCNSSRDYVVNYRINQNANVDRHLFLDHIQKITLQKGNIPSGFKQELCNGYALVRYGSRENLDLFFNNPFRSIFNQYKVVFFASENVEKQFSQLNEKRIDLSSIYYDIQPGECTTPDTLLRYYVDNTEKTKPGELKGLTSNNSVKITAQKEYYQEICIEFKIGDYQGNYTEILSDLVLIKLPTISLTPLSNLYKLKLLDSNKAEITDLSNIQVSFTSADKNQRILPPAVVREGDHTYSIELTGDQNSGTWIWCINDLSGKYLSMNTFSFNKESHFQQITLKRNTFFSLAIQGKNMVEDDLRNHFEVKIISEDKQTLFFNYDQSKQCFSIELKENDLYKKWNLQIRHRKKYYQPRDTSVDFNTVANNRIDVSVEENPYHYCFKVETNVENLAVYLHKGEYQPPHLLKVDTEGNYNITFVGRAISQRQKIVLVDKTSSNTIKEEEITFTDNHLPVTLKCFVNTLENNAVQVHVGSRGNNNDTPSEKREDWKGKLRQLVGKKWFTAIIIGLFSIGAITTTLSVLGVFSKEEPCRLEIQGDKIIITGKNTDAYYLREWRYSQSGKEDTYHQLPTQGERTLIPSNAGYYVAVLQSIDKKIISTTPLQWAPPSGPPPQPANQPRIIDSNISLLQDNSRPGVLMLKQSGALNLDEVEICWQCTEPGAQNIERAFKDDVQYKNSLEMNPKDRVACNNRYYRVIILDKEKRDTLLKTESVQYKFESQGNREQQQADKQNKKPQIPSEPGTLGTAEWNQITQYVNGVNVTLKGLDDVYQKIIKAYKIDDKNIDNLKTIQLESGESAWIIWQRIYELKLFMNEVFNGARKKNTFKFLMPAQKDIVDQVGTDFPLKSKKGNKELSLNKITDTTN